MKENWEINEEKDNIWILNIIIFRMEIEDNETKKYFTIKCFDACISSFKHKLLTPHEQ